MARKQSLRTRLLTEAIEAQRWLDDHGGTLAGYVARYGSASDPDHYGSGGEAIYAADLAALNRARAAYQKAVL
jgi:hypothetical protein